MTSGSDSSDTPDPSETPDTAGTSDTRRLRRWLLVAAIAALLVAIVAVLVATTRSDDSDDSDDGPGTNDTNEAGGENGQEPSSNGQEEPVEASNHDAELQLTVDSVARDDDLLVIEGTLTNTGDERFIPTGQLAELDFGGLERFESNDLSGFVLIDWEHSTAHYPARTDTGDCACTIVEDYREAVLDPGASMDYFVAYKLDDPAAELTLVAPGFQPVDGLPVPQE